MTPSNTNPLLQSFKLNSITNAFLRHPKVPEYALIVALNLGMTVIKTWMHSKAYQNEGFSKEDRQLLNTQEWVRQSISTALWLTSLVVSYLAVKKVLPQQSQMGRILLTNLISSLPDAFLRPFLTAKISKRLLDNAVARIPSPPAKQEAVSDRQAINTRPQYVIPPARPVIPSQPVTYYGASVRQPFYGSSWAPYPLMRY